MMNRSSPPTWTPFLGLVLSKNACDLTELSEYTKHNMKSGAKNRDRGGAVGLRLNKASETYRDNDGCGRLSQFLTFPKPVGMWGHGPMDEPRSLNRTSQFKNTCP